MSIAAPIADREQTGVDVAGRGCPRCDHLETKLARLSATVAASGTFKDDGRDRPVPEDVPTCDVGAELSLRQYQIGVLLSQGKTNAEIGEALFLGVNSVKTHVKGLYRALDVRNRTEAALWFVRTGQVDP